MKGLPARLWLLGMIAVLLLFTYVIFWAQPPEGWASGSPPSVSTIIRALQTKDSRLNDLEVAVWRHLPVLVQSHCDSVGPRLARETRREACRRLGLLGTQATNAVPYLIKALDDPDLVVRSSAILDLRAIGPPAKAAKGPLLATLKDLAYGSPTNQFLVMEADLVPDTLAAIAPRDREVVSALLELIAQRSATNQFFIVQAGRVAATLAAMAPQDPEVISALLELIAHPGPFVWPSPIARAWLQHTPEPLPVFELIRKVLPQRDSWDLVSSVAQSCQDPKKRLAVFLSLAGDPDYGIRYHAVHELGALGQLGAGAVPRLMELFGATEREWEDLPENPQQARFEAYTAFVKATTPQGPFAHRYGLPPGPVQVLASTAGPAAAPAPRPAPGLAASPPPAEAGAPAPPAAPPPAPGTAAAAGAPIAHRFATRGTSQRPMESVPGFFGLHHQVILALGEMGPRARDAIPLLVREYQDPTSPLRFEAAVARVQVDRNFPEVMPVLAAGLEQAGPGLRAALLPRIAQLAGSYDGAVVLLIKALADSDSKLRLQAFKSLASLGDKAAPALPVLIAALDDPESEIRFQALRDLGELGANAAPAVPALIKVLGDPERSVRLQAVTSLAALGDKAAPALPALRQLASDPIFSVRIVASNIVRTLESATNSRPGGQGSGPAR